MGFQNAVGPALRLRRQNVVNIGRGRGELHSQTWPDDAALANGIRATGRNRHDERPNRKGNQQIKISSHSGPPKEGRRDYTSGSESAGFSICVSLSSPRPHASAVKLLIFAIAGY